MSWLGDKIHSVGSALGFGGDPSPNAYSPGAYDSSALNSLMANAQNPQAYAQQVQQNPMLAGIFGKGGTLQQATDQASQLQKTGFQLQPEDYQAYGQASNNLARMFGSQESDLSNSLAQRGFGNSASGAAGAQFTGLQGNKNEQLAQAQGQIAHARMNFAQNALNSTRESIAQMAGLGESATNDAYNRLAGTQSAYNTSWGTQAAAQEASAASKLGSTSPTLGQYLGAGLGSSVFSVGATPGKMVSNAAGGAAGGNAAKGGGLGGSGLGSNGSSN